MPAELYEFGITCPYCRADITVYSLMELIIETRRICPQCKREILIRNGRGVEIPGEERSA